MKNLKEIFFKFASKSRTFNELFKYYNNQILWTPVKFEKMAQAGYKENPYVFASIRVISKAFSSVDWILYQDVNGRKEERKEILRHPLLEIMKKPNEYQSGTEFRADWISYLLLSGNTYIERIGTNDGRVKQLYLLRPDRILIKTSANPYQLIDSYIYNVCGYERAYTYNSNLIKHTKLFNPLDDYYGQPVMESISHSIDQNNLGREWNSTLLQNGGRPSALFKTEKMLTDEQYERTKQMLYEKSLENSGKPWLLEGGTEYVPMQMNAEDIGWMSGAKLSAKEIALGFGVPSEMIGDSSNKTYSNFQEARKALYQETVIPYLELYKSILNSWLTPMFGEDYELDFDIDSIEALSEERSAIWDKAQKSNFLTINEKRNMVGYGDLQDESGEAILVPSSMIKLGSEPNKEDENKDDMGIFGR